MLKNFFLVQLIEIFVKCLKNCAVSKVDDARNEPIIFDINCNL